MAKFLICMSFLLTLALVGLSGYRFLGEGLDGKGGYGASFGCGVPLPEKNNVDGGRKLNKKDKSDSDEEETSSDDNSSYSDNNDENTDEGNDEGSDEGGNSSGGDQSGSMVIKVQSGPAYTVNYSWEFYNSAMANNNEKLSLEISKHDLGASQGMQDKLDGLNNLDLGVPTELYESDANEYYRRYLEEEYRMLCNGDGPRMDYIVKGIEDYAKEKGMNSMDAILNTIAFIQHVPYGAVNTDKGILAPLVELKSRYGDCDTHAVCLYILLRKLGVDAVILYSVVYNHVVLAVAMGNSGLYKSYNGKKYYILETAGPHWDIGKISADWNNMGNWLVIDLNR